MSYTVLNGAQFKASVARQLDRVRVQFENRLRFVMTKAWIHASSISPTYRGDFSENWNVSVGSPDTYFKGTPMVAIPRDEWSGVLGRFDMPPGFLGRSATPTATKNIYMANAAVHDEPYAVLIENNQIAFRPPNRNKGRVAYKTSREILRLIGT